MHLHLRVALLQEVDHLRLNRFIGSFVEYKPTPRLTLREFRDKAERRYIIEILGSLDWNISRAATLLGVERTNLHKKIRGLGILNIKDLFGVAAVRDGGAAGATGTSTPASALNGSGATGSGGPGSSAAGDRLLVTAVVMGEASMERAATAEETARIAALIGEAVDVTTRLVYRGDADSIKPPENASGEDYQAINASCLPG